MVGAVGVCGGVCRNVSEDLLAVLVVFIRGYRGWEAVDCGANGRGGRGVARKFSCVG